MKRRPQTRIISSGGAGRGGGLFTVHVTPDDYSLQSGPVEETEAQQGDVNKMNETTFGAGADAGAVEGAVIVTNGMYTPDEDVVATLDDGRTIQVAVKGTPMPLSQAFAHGLIDAQGNKVAQVGPSETKESPKKGSAPSQGAPADEAGATDSGDENKDKSSK